MTRFNQGTVNERQEKGKALGRGRKINQALLKQAKSGDNPDNHVRGRLKWCRWGAPKSHTTRNISEICDTCWRKKA